MIASPSYLSSVPPFFSRISVMAVRYSLISSTSFAASPIFSEKVEKLWMSVK